MHRNIFAALRLCVLGAILAGVVGLSLFGFGACAIESGPSGTTIATIPLPGGDEDEQSARRKPARVDDYSRYTPPGASDEPRAAGIGSDMTSEQGQSAMDSRAELATFGAGCFWGVEHAFRQLPGVIDVVSGYSGGQAPNPGYEAVCTGATGHAEVVQVTYDPSRISYEKLLETFFSIHDPTTLNRQGPDVGTQYRSAIYHHTPAQRAAAESLKERLENVGAFRRRPIVTEIAPAGAFHRAEEYHQRYVEKHGVGACPTHLR